ncbi:hypothetical protein [Maribacter sp. 2210JD10-5]|uniref:hypothetical protein n=1 Tax=Maribacter sp. 2210JD10-5 TaxID=3386272 RepID=UPI0039BD3EDA
MGIKTSQSYQKEVLEKYKKRKGGELSTYLLKPTPRLIKQACVLLLDRRVSAGDSHILNCFFQFRNEENRLREIQDFDNNRFRPIVNFLKGRARTTSSENIELISWLVNFQPRPLQEYLKPDNSISEEEPERSETEIVDEPNDEKEKKKQEEEKRRLEGVKKKEEEEKEKRRLQEERRRRRRIITISISVAFGMTLMILGVQKWPSYFPKNNPKDVGCMAWADSLYVEVSCDEAPFSKYGTRVKPLNPIELKNMCKVEVDAAYQFFTATGKPRIWYYKKSIKEIEYFTAPGLHPTNGETLRKITPYIIETYVPIHSKKKNSFIE